jgi:uncharacterized protein YfkK (UPF0435 family)
MWKFKQFIRKKLFIRLNNRNIERFYSIYDFFFHHRELQKRVSYGKINPDKTFFVVRPRIDGIEGLMSLFMSAMENVYYAEQKGYIPVIDFQNYYTQYYVEGKNIWNYYFTQPSKYPIEEIRKSKNIILSGIAHRNYELFNQSFNPNDLRKLHDFIFSKIDFAPEVYRLVEQELIGINLKNTLGLYLRGTDYIQLKPSGHPVQPTVEQAIIKVDELIAKYRVDKIFLVTEDERIYFEINKRYNNKCIIASFDSFISNYSGKDYLSKDKRANFGGLSSQERGLIYLCKLVILSKCGYLIGGNTMGSWAACAFSEGEYIEQYIFDLGKYGK